MLAGASATKFDAIGDTPRTKAGLDFLTKQTVAHYLTTVAAPGYSK